MPLTGFKPKTAVFEWEKTFRAVDLAATVIGRIEIECIDRFERLVNNLRILGYVLGRVKGNGAWAKR
jgi:hypothetical protein